MTDLFNALNAYESISIVVAQVFGVRVPLKMDYLTLGLSSAHGGSDAQWTLVGVPDRAYLWLMTRTKPVFYEVPLNSM